jgi:hypothetical protein
MKSAFTKLRVCQLCSAEFRSPRRHAMFCTPACRQLAYRLAHGKSKKVRSKQLVGPGKFPPGSWDTR